MHAGMVSDGGVRDGNSPSFFYDDRGPPFYSPLAGRWSRRRGAPGVETRGSSPRLPRKDHAPSGISIVVGSVRFLFSNALVRNRRLLTTESRLLDPAAMLTLRISKPRTASQRVLPLGGSNCSCSERQVTESSSRTARPPADRTSALADLGPLSAIRRQCATYLPLNHWRWSSAPSVTGDGRHTTLSGPSPARQSDGSLLSAEVVLYVCRT